MRSTQCKYKGFAIGSQSFEYLRERNLLLSMYCVKCFDPAFQTDSARRITEYQNNRKPWAL